MVFTPLRTARLLIRPLRPDDAVALAARRSEPEVARYQNWLTPYPVERAESMIADIARLEGPTDGEWWMAAIADPGDTTVIGDLVVHLTWGGRTAEIGYTLTQNAWGKGYAAEAAEALVTHLFETMGVTRVEAMLHPDNAASALVLERLGLLFEGHTRASFWLGDDNSDDWIYGMTRSDWEAWRSRPRQPAHDVSLSEVTAESLAEVRRLRTHRSQERFVAPVAQSLGDALLPPAVDGHPVEPWYRCVVADGDIVGFVMLSRSNDVHREPYLWRLLIDRMHQRRGIGRRVIDLVIAQCRTWGDRTLMVSWVPGKGSPEPMYLSLGFAPTGDVVDGEVVARLRFDEP
jgi:RimJ/RimL family protein N-acetyltransferase